MSNNENLTNYIIVEKDKIKLKYKQKLNCIKQHYGVEFDVEHSKSEKINSIKFINLKYKNNFDNVSVVYDNTIRKFNYIEYEYLDTRMVKGLNHKKLLPNLEKEYKLRLIVAEVERVNNEYRKEIDDINSMLINTPKEIENIEHVLQIRKNEEN